MVLGDFHTHSLCSDGELTPTQLVEAAARRGLGAVALTDHDTVAGLEEALEAGNRLGIQVVPGVELTFWDGEREGHLLGLWIDPRSLALRRALDWSLRLRVLALLRRWGPLGPLGEGEAAALRSPWRTSAKGGLSPEEAVQAVRESGGLAVIPHLHLLGADWEDCQRRAARLTVAGAVGLEVFHSGYDQLWRARAQTLRRALGLLPFGGSDFHRPGDPARALGSQPVPAHWGRASGRAGEGAVRIGGLFGGIS